MELCPHKTLLIYTGGICRLCRKPKTWRTSRGIFEDSKGSLEEDVAKPCLGNVRAHTNGVQAGEASYAGSVSSATTYGKYGKPSTHLCC